MQCPEWRATNGLPPSPCPCLCVSMLAWSCLTVRRRPKPPAQPVFLNTTEPLSTMVRQGREGPGALALHVGPARLACMGAWHVQVPGAARCCVPTWRGAVLRLPGVLPLRPLVGRGVGAGACCRQATRQGWAVGACQRLWHMTCTVAHGPGAAATPDVPRVSSAAAPSEASGRPLPAAASLPAGTWLA